VKPGPGGSKALEGVSELQVVGSLMDQVPSLGVKVRLAALDAGFYSVDFLNYISRFKFVMAVPIGDVRIRREYDGQHQERGKGGTGQLQAPGPVKGKERMIYVARVTNLPEVLELYDGVRNPMEPADQGLPALH